jgi:RNA recognition motif-containing protein
MNIQISNLHTDLKDEDLRNLFTLYGEVTSAEIAMDAFTDRPRGFGFVEMPNEEEAQKAITALNQLEVKGLIVSVLQANPPKVHKGSYKVGNGTINVYRFKKN